MAGDVLSIPFPPITVPLLGTRPPRAVPCRRHPSAWAPCGTFTLPHPRDGTVTVELLGPAIPFWRRQLRRALGRAPAADPDRQGSWRWFRLAMRLLRACPQPRHRSLWSIPFLAELWQQAGVVAYRHQLETAWQVLFRMGGRAILADEVGLGKTVEAGLVLHELLLRRLVRRALILVPSGLMWQWYRELRDKFDLPVELQASEQDWLRVPLLIASLDTAKRPPHRERVSAHPYDLVIVDEAHRLKNHRTRAYQLVAALKSRYLLLLTATPVHNSLQELHALCYLVAPQEVGELQEFCRRFGARGRRADDPLGLRELVRRHMVRHRRQTTPLPFPRREVHTRPVELSAAERAFYEGLDRLVAPQGADPDGRPPANGLLPPLLWLTLKREACSSPAACCATLKRLAERHPLPALQQLIRQGEQLSDWAKGEAVVRLVRELGDEHVLVFTEYSETQQALARRLAELGRPVVLFHGGLSPLQREWAQAVFRERAPVMVCTDAAAEGLNLQFCRHLINADLPWNPMRIEQRIGRLHRLGQTRDVHIWNLYTRQTVEEYVLYLLHEKLNLFRTVVGELDGILEPLGGAARFEQALARAFTADRLQDAQRLHQALEELVRQWNAALQRYLNRMRLQSELLGDA